MSSHAILVVLFLPALACAADMKGDLIAAARQLAAQTNYSWTQIRLPDPTEPPLNATFPLVGQFELPATIYVARAESMPWEDLPQYFTNQPIPIVRHRYTNELLVVDQRCTVKARYITGDVINFLTNWVGYATPRPIDGRRSYLISVRNPPHAELERFIDASSGVTHESGTFILSFAPDRMLWVRTNGVPFYPLAAANGSVKLWISNNVPLQYEVRIVETLSWRTSRNNGPPGRLRTSIVTNHTLTKIHNIGTTSVQIPPDAERALQHTIVPGTEPRL